jgi:outer membrane protein assembly factor BamB
MKREAVVSFVLIVLFLVSVFPLSIFSGVADSSRSSGLLGSQFTEDPTDWWTMFHYDMTHTGYSTSTAPNTNQTLWTYATGNSVESSPAVADGVVYVGSFDGNVYALNATTGAQVWNYTTGASVYSSPAVAGGLVYVGSADYKVYALNATTGVPVWNYTTGDFVHSSPAVANGVVYVGSFDGNIYALNATTGALVWDYTIGDFVVSSPAVADGVVYVGSYDSTVYALEAATGVLVWKYRTRGTVWSSPAVANGIVYVGSDDGKVYAFGPPVQWPMFHHDLSHSGYSTSTGPKTNRIRWTYRTGDVVWSSPAVVDGVVYVGSYDGKVYALSASTGVSMWNFTTVGWWLLLLLLLTA